MEPTKFDEDFLEDIKSSSVEQKMNEVMNRPEESHEIGMQKELDQMNVIANKVVENINTDRDKSDEMYSFFQDLIDINGDKSGDTRTAMTRALELKMKGTDQMLEILKVKAKLINPNKGSSININLGNYDSKRGSDTNDLIDLVENLRKESDNSKEE